MEKKMYEYKSCDTFFDEMERRAKAREKRPFIKKASEWFGDRLENLWGNYWDTCAGINNLIHFGPQVFKYRHWDPYYMYGLLEDMLRYNYRKLDLERYKDGATYRKNMLEAIYCIRNMKKCEDMDDGFMGVDDYEVWSKRFHDLMHENHAAWWD